MKIILNKDVNTLGEEGDAIIVKDGYARNYLLPTGAAVAYNKPNLALFASRAAAIKARKVEKRKQAASLKDKINSTTLTIVVSAGDSGKLFGSVTSAMIQSELAKNGIEIERKRIEISSHLIKNIGNYSIGIRLYENEAAEVKLIVESENVIKQREMAAAKVAAEEAAALATEKSIAAAKAAMAAKAEEAEEVATPEEAAAPAEVAPAKEEN